LGIAVAGKELCFAEEHHRTEKERERWMNKNISTPARRRVVVYV
jgi:hypothetical protein